MLHGGQVPAIQKSTKAKSQEFQRLVDKVNTEDIQAVYHLLEKKGYGLLLYCIENPEKLKTGDGSGWWIADTIASYAPTRVVKLLLDTAKANDEIKNIIYENHDLEGGITVNTFQLAIATLRNREEDIAPYL